MSKGTYALFELFVTDSQIRDRVHLFSSWSGPGTANKPCTRSPFQLAIRVLRNMPEGLVARSICRGHCRQPLRAPATTANIVKQYSSLRQPVRGVLRASGRVMLTVTLSKGHKDNEKLRSMEACFGQRLGPTHAMHSAEVNNMADQCAWSAINRGHRRRLEMVGPTSFMHMYSSKPTPCLGTPDCSRSALRSRGPRPLIGRQPCIPPSQQAMVSGRGRGWAATRTNEGYEPAEGALGLEESTTRPGPG